MNNTLSTIEQKQFESYEVIIQNGLETFVQVGLALCAIRDQRLYRAKHRTFEEYCLERWNMARRTADRLIGAAEVVENVRSATPEIPQNETHGSQILPANERQTRPLTSLPPEQQRAAWQQSVATAPNGKVTAAHVASVARQFKPAVQPRGGADPDIYDYPDEIPAIDGEPISETHPYSFEHLYRGSTLATCGECGETHPRWQAARGGYWVCRNCGVATPDDAMQLVTKEEVEASERLARKRRQASTGSSSNSTPDYKHSYRVGQTVRYRGEYREVVSTSMSIITVIGDSGYPVQVQWDDPELAVPTEGEKLAFKQETARMLREYYEGDSTATVPNSAPSNGRHKPKSNYSSTETEPEPRDQCQTPSYALNPLLPFLETTWTVWEPARGEGLLVDALADAGINSIISGDILTGQNFFAEVPEQWDCIVTNPPFSLKYRWLKRCYALDKPFALLMPLETLGSKKAQALFRAHGVEVIFMNERVDYKMVHQGWDGAGAQFPSAWFTWQLALGQQMVFADISELKSAFLNQLKTRQEAAV